MVFLILANRESTCDQLTLELTHELVDADVAIGQGEVSYLTDSCSSAHSTYVATKENKQKEPREDM